MRTTSARSPAASAAVRRVVLTGGIATGKSTVLGRFAALGVPTIDADELAHAAVAPGGPAWQAVRDRFGAGMFDQQGHLDRQRLGALVFQDPSALAALNGIVHPHVRASIEAWFDTIAPPATAGFAVAAIPLFFESPRRERFDRVIVTACDDDTQLARVMDRGLDERQARQRIAAQLPTAEKVRLADFTIWTDGSHDQTRRRVDEICRELSVAAP